MFSGARNWLSQALENGLDTTRPADASPGHPTLDALSSHPVNENLPTLDELLEELEHDDPAADSDPPSDEENQDDSEEDDWAEGPIRPEDEDWEVAEKDFTKQFNRLRQHAAVYNGTAAPNPTTKSVHQKLGMVSLPPVNKPPKLKQKATGALPTKEPRTIVTSDQLALLQKYNARLSNIAEPYEGLNMGAGVNRKGPSATANRKDKADRATTELVLDPRTRLILYKMIGRGLLFEVNGCISTGKEANVYHAFNPSQAHLAIKIYKTSVLIFKDRDRYVAGEYRFRRGYARHNPRKMVRLWAEKEMRNLKRLVAAGVRCPEPVEVRENVLVMEFLGGEDGWPAPRLKDADLPPTILPTLYTELLIIIRRLYHACHLIHADLSEYNILFHKDHLYIIDVSQGVEHDHPHALDFLRSDISNVEDFWGKRGVRTLGLRKAFEFIVSEGAVLGLLHEERKMEKDGGEGKTTPADPSPSSDAKYAKDESYLELEKLLLKWLDEPAPTLTDTPNPSDATQEDAVFKASYIPRTLYEVVDPERDVELLNRGQGKALIYSGVTGVVHRFEEVEKRADEGGDDGEEEEEEEESDEGEGEEGGRKTVEGRRGEDKEAKKERQRLVKEQAREKRKTKMPKADKAKLVKKTKRW